MILNQKRAKSVLADPTCCEKYLKDICNNSLHLTLKICSDIFPWSLSVPRSSVLGTDNVSGQISEHIFLSNGDYCCIYGHVSQNIFVWEETNLLATK